MAPLDSVCRLVFQLDGGRQIGHLALVTDSDPEQGIYCELITLLSPDGEAYWLPHSERGLAWDWLRDVPINVTYAEDEEGNNASTFEASVIDCELQNFMLFAAFTNGDEPEWVSLIEDDWSWIDCEPPVKSDLFEALDAAEKRAVLINKANAAADTNAKLYLLPPAPPAQLLGPSTPAENPVKRSHHRKRSRTIEEGGIDIVGGSNETNGGGSGKTCGSSSGFVKSPAPPKKPVITYTVREWSGGRVMPLAPPPLSPSAQFIAHVSLAVRALSSESLDELDTAAATLREASSKGGTLALAALVELKALPLLVALMRRAIASVDRAAELEDAPPAPDVETLLLNAGITLVNGSHYVPARSVLHKCGAIDLAAALLSRSEAQLEIALALLQNLSLCVPVRARRRGTCMPMPAPAACDTPPACT